MVGDGVIIARVVNVQNERSLSSFGVMLRDSLDPGAPYAAMMIANNSGDQSAMLGRTAAAGAVVSESRTAVAEPYWLKLVRAGNTFAGYASPDGMNWSQVGTSRTIALGTVAFVGLAVASGDPTQITTVSFDNVTVSSGADFYLVSSPASRTAPLGAGVYYHSIKMLPTSGSRLPV